MIVKKCSLIGREFSVFCYNEPARSDYNGEDWIGNSTVYLFAMVLGKKTKEKIQLFWYLLKKLDFKNHMP